MLELLFLYLIIFVFGLIIGSFLNCVIYRLEVNELRSFPRFVLSRVIDESPLKGRSYCPKCKHILKWEDLIPVLSFIILKGRCRYCSQKISWQYPLVELTTGILFVLIANYTFPDLLITGYLLLITCFLIVIFVYDLKHYLIPDKIIYPAIIIAGIFNFYFFSILSAILAALFFGILVLITHGRGMGVGDIKLAFFMGLFLGWPNILIALFLAFFLGSIIGIGLIFFKKKTLKSKVPFAPFLIVGIFIALFGGDKIIDWYWNLFFFLLK
jgi:prepilin signal peptidase PulO-like enzyme (type II secretory pathway)